MRILIVDDVIINTVIIARILKRQNIEYVIKNNGKQAFELLKYDNNFDIIIMDIEMPIMNGIEAAKKINSFLDINIIALTSHKLNEFTQLKVSGFSDYIEKPVDSEKLLTIINQINIAV